MRASAPPADVARFESKRAVPVIGSESLTSLEACADLLRAVPDAILSLDTRDDVALGPSALFNEPELWPQRVIVMTLDRVGGGQGPALERLQTTLAQAAGKQVIAAGGVRNADDLDTLAEMGVYAVLIATAIHDGTLDRATLGALPERLDRAQPARSSGYACGYLGEKGCFTELRLEMTSAGCGSPLMARSSDSLVAL